MKSSDDTISARNKSIVVAICILVAGLHLITGPDYSGPLRPFVTGYLIDILLPFAMYLLLGVQDLKVLQGKFVRVVLVFGLAASSETLQYHGVEIFGRTYDPLDYLMFGVGIAGAALFEWAVLSRLAGTRTE